MMAGLIQCNDVGIYSWTFPGCIKMFMIDQLKPNTAVFSVMTFMARGGRHTLTGLGFTVLLKRYNLPNLISGFVQFIL